MGRAFAWLYRRLGSRYLTAILVFEVFSAFLICLGTVGVLALYEEMEAGEFWRVVAFSELCVALALIFGSRRIHTFTQPLRAWVRGARDPDSALAAWRTAIGVPVDSPRRPRSGRWCWRSPSRCPRAGRRRARACRCAGSCSERCRSSTCSPASS